MHTTSSTLVRLHVLFFYRPSSGQYFPVEGTNAAHYTLWDPILLYRVCVKTITEVFKVQNTAEQGVVYLKHYVGVYCQLQRYFHYKNCVAWYINIQVMSSSKTCSILIHHIIDTTFIMKVPS